MDGWSDHEPYKVEAKYKGKTLLSLAKIPMENEK